METMSGQIYKMKLQLIIERESLLSHSQLLNKDWFPNFIVIRRKTRATDKANDIFTEISKLREDNERMNAKLDMIIKFMKEN